MLKKFRLPILALGTALTLLSPAGAFARDHDRDREWREHHRHVRVYVGPAYRYGYANGYYDRWGYWHPYGGFYDRWGRYHPY
jgi:hypothetical protein